jgi:ABC-type branched-subunit amino acid transport system permease subunit
MSLGVQFYTVTLLVYAGVAAMACLGLHVQYSCAGIVNLGFIIFQAGGAYTAAVLTLGPSVPASRGGFQQYTGGSRLPFPLPLLAAMAVGALLSVLLGLVVLSRLRRDYQATVFLVIAVVANQVVANDRGLFNGQSGLALIPQPLQSWLNLSDIGYNWAYAAYTVALTLAVYLAVRAVTRAPLGLAWRAMRDDDTAAAALGLKLTRLRLTALALGGAIAGLSGAVLVQFIGAWSPQSWLFPETLALFTALIVGGAGNELGAVAGAVVVLVLLQQAPGFLPQFFRPGFIDALEWVITALLTLLFLWFRPQGLLPERLNRLAADQVPGEQVPGEQAAAENPAGPAGPAAPGGRAGPAREGIR